LHDFLIDLYLIGVVVKQDLLSIFVFLSLALSATNNLTVRSAWSEDFCRRVINRHLGVDL
jgi:hypothetical protein